MTSKRKLFRLVFCSAVLLTGAGCSGINASKSVSPLDFILPGLLQNEPLPAKPTSPQAEPAVVVAQAR